MSDIEEPQPEPQPEAYISPYNLDFFLEHFEDVCPEDFEGFTQQHFDRIGNMFFALEVGQSAKRLHIPKKPSKSSSTQVTCECGSILNKSSMKSHIKTNKHQAYIASSVAISSETHPIPCSSPPVEPSPS
jgi:hypothetical protein